jgi:hypothetical protein
MIAIGSMVETNTSTSLPAEAGYYFNRGILTLLDDLGNFTPPSLDDDSGE